MNFREFATLYLEAARARVQPRTYEFYVYLNGCVLHMMEHAELADVPLDRLRKLSLQLAVNHLYEECPEHEFGDTTATKVVKHLRQMLEYAVKFDEIEANPAAHVEARHSEPKPALPFRPPELQALLGWAPRSEAQFRDYALLLSR